MGLRLRGDAWWFRKNVGGQRHEVPLGVYGGEPNRAKAEKAARAMADTLTEGHAGLKVLKKLGIAPAKPKGDVPTFAEWWATCQTTYEPEKKPSTQKRNREIVAHWLLILGDKALDAIRQVDCVAGLATRRQSFTSHLTRKTKTRISENSIQRERRTMQAIFERAVENDVIPKNPWKGIEARATTTRSDRILTEEDQPKLLAALNTLRKDARGRMVSPHPRYTRFLLFMLETGLRIDELLNTHFRDGGDYVHVNGKFSKERDVPLTCAARRLLDEQWADPDRPKTAKGRPWWQCDQRFRTVLKVAAKRAGIPHLSPHDLRHTFGHRYLVRGGDIYDLSKILGHASVAVTERHYAYLRKEDVRDKMLAVMEPAGAKVAKPARRLVRVK